MTSVVPGNQPTNFRVVLYCMFDAKWYPLGALLELIQSLDAFVIRLH